ncbi:MAG: indole-3-glycerol phosphate synthase TrpC [Chloroflexi bacterium]|nr:indole-3-glycerol phosphate synthase TrpC [Chloroflexota bacterium]
MATILDSIVETKRQEVERHKKESPLSSLEERIEALPVPLNLSGALMGDGPRLIAEAKKASPSRGLLRDNYDPASLAKTYADNGAAAVSVLTEKDNFQGSLEHMEAVKNVLLPLGVPVLRKDFIFDPYQVHEARAYGADALLLIVSILTLERLKELLRACQSLWLQALVEVHSEEEIDIALTAGAEIIGINNRDLRTFETDISVTERLASRVPRGKILVSESGIHSHDDLVRLGRVGVHAVLVGEAIVTSPDPGAKVRELLHGSEQGV